MQDPTSRTIAVLEQYMRDPGSAVASWTRLADLEIDLLDLPLIVLDLEDVFAIQIPYNEEIEGVTTVGQLVACVRAGLVAKSRPRATAPRSKGSWMSTSAERRG